MIIRDLSFAVSGGEAILLTGRNGAGKTTLLRALAGYLRPHSGSIRLAGGNPDSSIGEQAHVVAHANAIKTALTVRENVAFWQNFLSAGADKSEALDDALAKFGLSELSDFPAGYLSAGQKRRLGLARLLCAHRPVWLLDEPTVSLDTASTALLADAVNAHTRGGGIAIVATHLPIGLERARELKLGSLLDQGRAA